MKEKTETPSNASQLIQVFKNGELLVEETFQDVVKRVGSEKHVVLALLKNRGKINLDTFQEGIVMKPNGYLHHENSGKVKNKGQLH